MVALVLLENEKSIHLFFPGSSRTARQGVTEDKKAGLNDD